MCKVSVIIPTYNRAEFLRSAIKSVLDQTFQDFEIIVIDDASTDDTPGIIDDFNESRIRYLRHEINEGGSATRNTGIKVSNGKYIAFLDDDDEWLPEKLEMQVQVLESSLPEVGGVYTGFLKIDRTTGRVLEKVIPSKRGNLFKELVIGNVIGTASTPLLRKECFQKVGLFDENLPSSQDLDMWIRIAKDFHFECIRKPLVKKYIHNRRQIVTNVEATIKGREIIIKKNGKFASNKKGYSYFCLWLGVCYCYSGDIKKGRKAFLKAIGLYPFEIRHYFNLGLSLLGADAFKRLRGIKRLIRN